MRVSVLERLLAAERHRRKLQPGDSAFAPPAAVAHPVDLKQAPWVTSLSKGNFAPTFRTEEGFVGQALFECTIEEEDKVLRELVATLLTLQKIGRWTNVVKSLAEAKGRMISYGFEPKTLIVPFADLGDVVGGGLSAEEAGVMMLTKGCVAEVEGVKILTTQDGLPKGFAILGTLPTITGVYTRIYDHVGVTIFQADRSVVLVSDAVD